MMKYFTTVGQKLRTIDSLNSNSDTHQQPEEDINTFIQEIIFEVVSEFKSALNSIEDSQKDFIKSIQASIVEVRSDLKSIDPPKLKKLGNHFKYFSILGWERDKKWLESEIFLTDSAQEIQSFAKEKGLIRERRGRSSVRNVKRRIGLNTFSPIDNLYPPNSEERQAQDFLRLILVFYEAVNSEQNIVEIGRIKRNLLNELLLFLEGKADVKVRNVMREVASIRSLFASSLRQIELFHTPYKPALRRFYKNANELIDSFWALNEQDKLDLKLLIKAFREVYFKIKVIEERS